MQSLWNKHKWIFLLLINLLPFALDVILYTGGVTVDVVLFLPVLAGLTVLNYKSCKKTGVFLLYQAFMFLCILCAGQASIHLYREFISDDSVRPLIDLLLILLGGGIQLVVTLITAIVKACINNMRTTK